MKIARNIIVGLIFTVLALGGYIVYLTQLKPLPVNSNWDIKGYSNGIELRHKSPMYAISADGTVGAGAIKLTLPTQIVVTREGEMSPKLIENVESVSILMNGKVYVIRPTENFIGGFRER